jgi:hypothetical protein
MTESHNQSLENDQAYHKIGQKPGTHTQTHTHLFHFTRLFKASNRLFMFLFLWVTDGDSILLSSLWFNYPSFK